MGESVDTTVDPHGGSSVQKYKSGISLFIDKHNSVLITLSYCLSLKQ